MPHEKHKTHPVKLVLYNVQGRGSGFPMELQDYTDKQKDGYHQDLVYPQEMVLQFHHHCQHMSSIQVLSHNT